MKPQFSGWTLKNIWNHHPGIVWVSNFASSSDWDFTDPPTPFVKVNPKKTSDKQFLPPPSQTSRKSLPLPTATHRPGAKMREVPLPGLKRRTSPPSAAIRSASAKSSGLRCRRVAMLVGVMLQWRWNGVDRGGWLFFGWQEKLGDKKKGTHTHYIYIYIHK